MAVKGFRAASIRKSCERGVLAMLLLITKPAEQSGQALLEDYSRLPGGLWTNAQPGLNARGTTDEPRQKWLDERPPAPAMVEQRSVKLQRRGQYPSESMRITLSPTGLTGSTPGLPRQGHLARRPLRPGDAPAHGQRAAPVVARRELC